MQKNAKRFVSRLTQNTLALILAGGRGSRLGVLTDWRAKPAVPFGGKFRIVDFTLSNCLNSGIRRMCVLTQYKSHALIQHLLRGWSGLNAEQGEFVDIIPAQQWLDDESWYQGTADAVFQCLDIIEGYKPEYVLILAGDHIYAMDYGETLAAHVDSNADFTIACNPVPKGEASQFGVMQVDETHRLIDFSEKPDDPKTLPGEPDLALVSMGIYIFSFDYLYEQLHRDAEDKSSSHDFGKDLIPFACTNGDYLQAFPFRTSATGGASYWRDVGTIDAYYEANLEVLSANPPIDIYDPNWPIRTYQPQLPAARFVGAGKRCRVEDAMVSGGCLIVKSDLDRSLLYSNVKVGEGCDLQGVLALPGCEIRAGCRLKHVILDNGCVVPAGTVIGEDSRRDRQRFHISERGVVVVNREMLGQDAGYLPAFPEDG
jgi:glucose-1-phosphate adenylyltransferase